VVVQDPQTAETMICSEAGDWSPWSQQQACVGAHIAQAGSSARGVRYRYLSSMIGSRARSTTVKILPREADR
jgi:hypothetical protein